MNVFRRIERSYRTILDVTIADNLISQAIARKAYEDWLSVFNISLLFVTVRGNTKAQAKELKLKSYFQDVMLRGLSKCFNVMRIPTQDILSQVSKEELDVTIAAALPGIKKIKEL